MSRRMMCTPTAQGPERCRRSLPCTGRMFQLRSEQNGWDTCTRLGCCCPRETRHPPDTRHTSPCPACRGRHRFRSGRADRACMSQPPAHCSRPRTHGRDDTGTIARRSSPRGCLHRWPRSRMEEPPECVHQYQPYHHRRQRRRRLHHPTRRMETPIHLPPPPPDPPAAPLRRSAP